MKDKEKQGKYKMHQRLTLLQIKETKERVVCPSCKSETEVFTYTEEGEEFMARKCKDGCGYWGRE